jgi:hypothetical protein
VLVVTRWKEISALRNRFSPHTQFLSEKSTTKGMCICPIESSGREKMNQQGEYSVQIFWRHAIVLPHFDFKRERK